MKKRADLLLTKSGLAASRSQARALLMAGRVFYKEQRIDKPGALLPVHAKLDLRGGERFVSRGGIKLDEALRQLRVDVANAVAVDIGAATGGFTDCLLQRGAARVFAVDVGRGQLADRLRRDPRVVVMDRTNARYLDPGDFDMAIDWVLIDASFISLSKLLPAATSILRPGGHLLALVKPQFEAGRDAARRGQGVIREERVREAAIARVRADMAAHGLRLLGECDSVLPGPRGNVEHFILAQRGRSC